MISVAQDADSFGRAGVATGRKRWLVTGVAGFIGSNLLQQLLANSQSVVGLDNFSTGYRSNLDDVLKAPDSARGEFRMIEGDIRDLKTCREACMGVDYVLHQAALGSVPRSIDDPITSNAVNVDGFLNVLVAAHEAGVRRLVYASSCAVYGDAADLPLREDSAGQCLSPYATTKLANELYASVFQRTYGLSLVGLRYFNVFGPRQDPNGAYAAVIPRWIASLIAGERCQIHGDGLASRDFCYVGNVAHANFRAATAAVPDAESRVYNVGCGKETTLNELFRMIRLGLAGHDPSLAGATPEYGMQRRGDISRSCADISRIRAELGYEPPCATTEGLGQTLEWYVGNSSERRRRALATA
jgi:UDP-N-acetylglucosamine 4-epimerase